MLIHQSLDAIAKYFNTKIGDDKWNFENESFEQSRTKFGLMSTPNPMATKSAMWLL